MEEKKEALENTTVEKASSEGLSEDCEKKLKALEEELKKWKETALRYAAEVENLKKAFKREKEEYYKFALESVFKELLPSIDNLERSLEAFAQSQNLDALKEGVELSLKVLLQTLEKFGLTQFEPAIGDKFEPHIHEALSTEEHPEVPDGGITKVYQKGYKLHERVIRPALVCVCTGGKKEQGDEQKESEQKENKN
jgi:molecular chaperone GrpE